jgi:Flp pilus assembly protein TadB
MQLLPLFVIAGTLAVAIVGALVTGEWWILVFVPVIGIPYLVLDRRLRRREPPEERLAADPPRR